MSFHAASEVHAPCIVTVARIASLTRLSTRYEYYGHAGTLNVIAFSTFFSQA